MQAVANPLYWTKFCG